MRLSCFFRLAFFSLFLATFLTAQAPKPAQSLTFTEPLTPIPFNEWLAAGDRAEIPWSLEVFPARLSFYLRFYSLVRARVPTNWFRNRSGEHAVVFSVRVADSAGRWLSPETPIEARTAAELPRGSYLEFLLKPFVLPGDYTIAVILHDRTTGQRSVTRRRLIVSAPSNQFLPNAWRNLPLVEFPSDRLEGPDRSFLPGSAHLSLSVSNPVPVHLDVVLNFSTSEELSGSRRAARSNVQLLLAALTVFSQLRLERGSVRITALDVERRQILYEQDAGAPFDWPRLRVALEKRNPATIDASVLAGRHTNAAFFREILSSRLSSFSAPRSETQALSGTSLENSEPHRSGRRVIVLLRSPTYLPSSADFTPLAPPPGCNCAVYDFRFPAHPRNIWDNLGRVIKPLKPRTFHIESPDGFRRALATLLRDLSSPAE